MWETKKIAIAVTLLALAGGSWWLSKRAVPPEAHLDIRARHDPDFVIENFTATVMNKQGLRRYVLSAHKLVHFPDDDTSEFDRPYLIQFRDEKAAVHARADKGLLTGDGANLLMTGNVRVSRSRDPGTGGGEIDTEQLKIILNK
jgi:lipopolysaccharide export system protein LptC